MGENNSEDEDPDLQKMPPGPRYQWPLDMLTKQKSTSRRTNRESFRQKMLSLRVRTAVRTDFNFKF